MKALSQQKMKENNLKLIYMTVADTPAITRVQLAKRTHLTKTTVSSLVEDLLRRGFVVESEFCGGTPKPGRRPVSTLELDSSRNAVLAIVWEQHNLIFNVVAMNSTVLFRYEVAIADYSGVTAMIESVYVEVILPARKELETRLLGVTVVFPGVVNNEKGSLHSTILGVIEDSRLPERIQHIFSSLPVAFFNDTACLGYAEIKLTDLDTKNFAYINLNEGVGAVIFANGKMHQGAGAMTCQFGHMSLDRNGPICSCGNRGCTDILLGEIGLHHRGVEAGFSESDSPRSFRRLMELTGSGGGAVEALHEALSDDLAYALGILISLNYPRGIIIGGNGSVLGEQFLDRVRSKIKRSGFKQFTDQVEIYYTKLSKDALTKGAARYFMDEHYRFLAPMSDVLILG